MRGHSCPGQPRRKKGTGFAVTAAGNIDADPSGSVRRRRLTKSLFIRGYDCPLRLRHAIDGLPSQREEDHYLRMLAEGGFQFEKLVRASWPGEALRSVGGSPEEAASTTLDRLRDLRSVGGVLHEAVFLHGDFLARVDMLRVQGSKVLLCEIKAKSADGFEEGMAKGAARADDEVGMLSKRGASVTSRWRDYVADVAYQTVVGERALQAAGLGDLRVHPRLVLVNRNARGSAFDQFGNIRRQADSDGARRLGEADFEFVEQPPSGYVAPMVLEVDVQEAVRRLRHRSAQSAAESWQDLNLEELMAAMAEILHGQVVDPGLERGWKCRDCEFRVNRETTGIGEESGFSRCWGNQQDAVESLYELYRGGDYRPSYGNRNRRWVHDNLGDESGPAGIGGLPRDHGGGSRAATRNLQISTHRDGTTAVSGELSRLVTDRLLPRSGDSTLHFIDFETATACLPYETGMHPYEVVAFQFSSHSLECYAGDVDVSNARHRAWLDPMQEMFNAGRDPRVVDRFFLDALREAIGDEAPVMHWSPHERTVLRELRARLEPAEDADRIEWIRQLAGDKDDHGRLVDMLAIAEGNIMSPHQRGRYSMKFLLPAACREDHVWARLCQLMGWLEHLQTAPGERDPYRLLPSIPGAVGAAAMHDCDEEDDSDSEAGAFSDSVRCGTDAIRAFQQLRFGPNSTWAAVDARALRDALKLYCRLDTAAMVAIWVWMVNLARHG